MTHYEIFLSASVITFNIVLCVLVYSRGLQERLPFFAGYATIILVTSLSQAFVYEHYGFRTNVSFYFFAISYGVVMLARSAAIVELCRGSLKPYHGIWALAWRILTIMALCFLIHAAIDAHGQPNWFATYRLTIERDVDIASFLILVAMLLIGNYYRLPMDSLQKWIALGICFFCITEFANSTVLRNLFTQYMYSWAGMKSQIERVNNLWNTVCVAASWISIGSWCFLLRKPLPAPAIQPVLLPAEIYQELAPAINQRLRTFNDRLLEVLNP